LIGKNRILTAAHCVCPNCTLSVGFGPNAHSDGNDKIVTDVVNVALHPLFQPSGPDTQPGHDLAVLATATYSSCAAYATPLPVYAIASVVAGSATQFAVVGYGLTEFGPNSAGEKRKANVVLSSATCTQAWARRSGCVSFTEFILEGSNTIGANALGADTCNGDSGGPALSIGNGGQQFLAGVTSRALVPRGGFNNLGCGFGGIYEYVGIPSVLAWLRNVVPDLRIAN
jgi:secreted trypsin-like serine protease